MKRDDGSAAGYGGNKPRKLAWLLADAERVGADTLVTIGAFGSHHVLATAYFGRARGFAVEAVLVPQRPSAHVEENLRADVALGAVLHPAKGPLDAWLGVRRRVAELKAAGKRPYVVAGGGSSPVGTLGYVAAARELASQLRAGEAEVPDTLVAALGSGGTVAGLAVGLAAEGLGVPVLGARIVTAWLSNRVLLGRLVEGTARLVDAPRARMLAREALRLVEVSGAALGEGYGMPTAAGERAMRLAAEDGLTLDATYTAKAFGLLVREASARWQGRPVLYWHTLSASMPPMPEGGAPPAPPWYPRA